MKVNMGNNVWFPEQITDSLVRILTEKGVSKDDAITIAKILLEGDLRGYNSHGINRIFQILDGFSNNTLSPIDCSEKIDTGKAISLFDGNGYIGQPLAKKAMLAAIENAKEFGVGVSGVINSGHIGTLGYYSELAAKEDCIGIVMSTSSPAVSLPGSGKKILGTNPISFSIPGNFRRNIISDFSTSKVSRGKIYEYLNIFYSCRFS